LRLRRRRWAGEKLFDPAEHSDRLYAPNKTNAETPNTRYASRRKLAEEKTSCVLVLICANEEKTSCVLVFYLREWRSAEAMESAIAKEK
jgi:hypothetical protein